MRKRQAGAIGWWVVAGTITLVDWWLIRHNRSTLSEVFGQSLKHPVKRWPVMTVWAIITLHLFAELLPQPIRRLCGRYDPIGAIAHLMEYTRLRVDAATNT